MHCTFPSSPSRSARLAITCSESPRIMRFDQFWALARLTEQVVDERLGMHLLLDVEGRGLDDEVAPVLLVLAAPDELGVEVAVAALVGDAQRLLGLLLDDRLVLGRRDVSPLGISVAVGLDALASRRLGFLRHQFVLARGWSTSIT